MTDYKGLIERLRAYKNIVLDRSMIDSALIDAANTIETILAERDAAVEDLSKRPHPSTCKYGKHCDYISVITGRPDCYLCHEWEWRGPQEKED